MGISDDTDIQGHSMHILDAKKAQIEASLKLLAEEVGTAIEQAVQCLIHRDLAECDAVIRADELIDDRRRMIEQDCLVTIASQQPVAHDLRDIFAATHIASELERLGDYACDIAACAKRMDTGALDGLGLDNILDMTRLSREMLATVMRADADNDVQLARQVAGMDDAMDALLKETIDQLLTAMHHAPELVRNGSSMMWVAHHLERCGDRATNIAEQVVFRLENVVANLG